MPPPRLIRGDDCLDGSLDDQALHSGLQEAAMRTFLLDIHFCMLAMAAVTDPAGAQALARRLPEFGLQPVQRRGTTVQPVADVPAYLQRQTFLNPAAEGNTWWLTFPSRLAGHEGGPDIHFNGRDFAGSPMNYCELRASLWTEHAPVVEPLAQRLLALGHAAYAQARPTLGYLVGGRGFDVLFEVFHVEALRLERLPWATWFGPPYVARYGRDFLLGLPGVHRELLPDGGIFHQLTPTLLVDDEQAANALREAVHAHFARAGLTFNTDFGTPSLEPLPSRRAMEVGLSQRPTPTPFPECLSEVLATTLRLADGTRLKVVALDWEALSPQERRTAVAAIAAAVREELAGHPSAPVRLELDAVPDDLRAALDAQAGEEPRFTYARVAGLSPDPPP
jgi:hypothetical protein